MELRDFAVTPVVLIIIYMVAYYVRPWFTDENTKRYFIPALTVRIIGAIALGFIYQFYYGGGDTFTYHTRGSRVIWEAFMASPTLGIKLIVIEAGNYANDIFKYGINIPFFKDPASYFVVRVASLFDIFTFSSYSATATLFSLISFSGCWALFKVFYSRYPHQHFLLALSVLFVPSVIFWGSGILKDTLALGAIGWILFCADRLFNHRVFRLRYIFILIVCLFALSIVKVYIIICLIPALAIWHGSFYSAKIKSILLKVVLVPIIIITMLFFGILSVEKVVEENPRYAFDNLAQTAYITAYDIRFYTGKDAGSGYYLGELDGTFQSLIALLPSAINVTLFRPYLWEVNNVLMLISAVESGIVLLLTFWVLFRHANFRIVQVFMQPNILFVFIFSITFAFAVGVSTYNFGTLVRYKIPMMPFYLTGLVMIYAESKRLRNASIEDLTE